MISASVPVYSLERYIAEELRDSEWIVSVAYLRTWLGQERMEIERTIAITPDLFKQHNHG